MHDPAASNWYADIATWQDLGNFDVGNCVVAAAMHQIMQGSAYAHPEHGVTGTTQEAIASYSAIGGYISGQPLTDQGLYVLGQGGLIEYWQRQGLMCGGLVNKPAAFIRLAVHDTTPWKQAIHYFGGVMVGLQLPKNVVATAETPFIWDDPSGPVVGGHEVYLCGYQTVADETLFDLISWGERYRATETFLLGILDEAVCVYDKVSLDARGVDPAGIDDAALMALMARF